jgi:sarcosine oxidase
VGGKPVEVAVVGVGAAGSAALWRLARRGVSCVGFEQFEPGHDRGSSTGESRIFRTAYFEGAGYVPLLQAALPLWRELEAETGQELLTLCGGLMIGPEPGRVWAGAHGSVRAHGLPHELLDTADLRRRYPQHVVADGDLAVFDPQAGFLRPEASIRAAAGRAQALGAGLSTGARVEAVEPAGAGFRLRTAAGEWEAERLVLAAGAWNPGFAAGVPLTVERVVQTWWRADDPAAFTPERFPVFVRELEPGFTRYGVPSTDGQTVKVAGHGGGAADPDRVDREPHEADWTRTAAVVRERMRGLATPPARAKVCMYTNTPDEHFVIGEAPELPGALLLSACSGHGFKFASVLGEIAAVWATGQAPPFDLEPFSPRRFARVP